MAEKRITEKAEATKKKVAKKAAKKSTKKTAKKAAKKTTKKVAKKVTSSRPSLDLCGSNIMGEQMMAGLQKINANAKSRAVHATLGTELSLPLIPVSSFLLQNALGTRGFPAQQIIEIIAAKYTGKSTFLGHLIGDFTRSGHPCAYFECEGKPPASEWFQRLASRDKQEGYNINSNMALLSPRSLPEMVEGLKKWGKAIREHTDIPDDKAIVAFIDPWSKLMSQAEAEGVTSFGVSEQKAKSAKEREIGTGSNQGHAKFAHEWMRKITAFMAKYNMTIFVVKHQNQEGVMNAQAAMYSSDLKNETSIGGEAIGQNAAIRIIGAPGSEWKDYQKNSIGNYTRWRVHKTSYGHGGKEFSTRCRSNPEQWRDTETHYDVSFDWSDGLANWMVDKGHFGARVNAKRYTCETIGAYNVTDEEFEILFNAPENRDNVEHLGFSLGIYGYEDVIAKRQAEAEKEARKLEREKHQAEKEAEMAADETPVKVDTQEPPVAPPAPEAHAQTADEFQILIGKTIEDIAVETTPAPPAEPEENVSGSFGPSTE